MNKNSDSFTNYIYIKLNINANFTYKSRIQNLLAIIQPKLYCDKFRIIVLL